jgi:geranylgeranyl pyrophosphate synthase
VLLLLQSGDESRRQRVRELILHENHSGHEELTELLRKSGALQSAIDTATRMVGEAREALEPVPVNKYWNGLSAIAGHLEGLLGKFR